MTRPPAPAWSVDSLQYSDDLLRRARFSPRLAVKPIVSLSA